MLAEALQAEVDVYIASLAGERDQRGRPLVVRNGYHQPREVLTSAGAVEVTAPRVNDKRVDCDTGERKRFASAILPPWARKTPKITEVLPLLNSPGLLVRKVAAGVDRTSDAGVDGLDGVGGADDRADLGVEL